MAELKDLSNFKLRMKYSQLLKETKRIYQVYRKYCDKAEELEQKMIDLETRGEQITKEIKRRGL